MMMKKFYLLIIVVLCLLTKVKSEYKFDARELYMETKKGNIYFSKCKFYDSVSTLRCSFKDEKYNNLRAYIRAFSVDYPNYDGNGISKWKLYRLSDDGKSYSSKRVISTSKSLTAGLQLYAKSTSTFIFYNKDKNDMRFNYVNVVIEKH
ncbi:hypothetical protein PIROE2DRAFT_11037 [Piromyces sp. E2]|nr:hypothetical protein PIROE2DRAFT_11037 [Piromyces sp. E2]|eukprot:OUM62607.1 hypothetical protein PIROE2DRAFT_11037 [Piromyces sp. E2]